MTWSRLVLEIVVSIAFLVPLEGDVDLESVASMEIFTLLWCFITSIHAERPRRTSAHLQLCKLQRLFRKSLEAARSNQIFPREKVIPG
jgi:hypothetical protein